MQKIIVGIDEAGRGPLAGPVVAAAFTLVNSKRVSDFGFRASNLKLRDSKLLSPIQRERIYRELCESPLVEWGIGQVSEKVIDKINIFQATKLAMVKAVENLQQKLHKRAKKSTVHFLNDRAKSVPNFVIDSLIIDGNFLLDLPISQKAIVKADATILECMAASIVAKVTRDRLILRLHKKYPQYGFD